MGSIEIDLFTTLDLVAQAPGGPDEDTEGGFAFGGWQATHPDDVVGEQIVAGIAAMDALLLGRKPTTSLPVIGRCRRMTSPAGLPASSTVFRNMSHRAAN